MKKQDEISILRETAAKLGPDSYCGTWLAEQIPFVESAIQSDMHPEFRALSIAQAEKKACELVEKGGNAAREIIAKAEKEAAEIIAKAQSKANNSIYRAAADLRAALKSLEN